MVSQKINDHSFNWKNTLSIVLVSVLMIGIIILGFINFSLKSQNDRTKSQTAQQTLKVDEKQHNLSQLENLSREQVHNNVVKSSKELYSILVENNSAHDRYTAAKKKGLIADTLNEKDAVFSGQYINVSNQKIEVSAENNDLTNISVYLMVGNAFESTDNDIYATSSAVELFYDVYQKKFTGIINYEF